jgi:ketosteroid isomerase-like protein
MSQENVEIVRQGLEHFRKNGLDSLMASLHPDIEWVPVQSDPEYSVHHGHDDVRAWLTSWTESFPDLRWETRSHPRRGERSRSRVRTYGGPL